MKNAEYIIVTHFSWTRVDTNPEGRAGMKK